MQRKSILVALLLSICVFAVSADLPSVPVFNCPPLPTPPPATNVNQLRPGNIKVIMAAGDSITAGFALLSTKVTNILKFNSNIKEYRGEVFSIGAKTSNSLNAYLSFYNSELVGASTGDTSPLGVKNDYMQVAPPDPAVSHLNAGQSGAIATDIPAQIDYLRNQLLTTYKYSVDFENDWKHLTLLIGANNLCQACGINETRASPENYEISLNQSLTYLRSQIPRVFVSVITMIKLSTVYNTFQQSTYCKSARSTFFNDECLCIAKNYSPKGLEQVDEYSIKYNAVLYKLANQFQALNDPGFTVKVQPATENFVIPESIGTAFLSEFDCFHPSAFADAFMGVALWNNLMSPSQAQKLKTIDLSAPLSCPDANTYLM